MPPRLRSPAVRARVFDEGRTVFGPPLKMRGHAHNAPVQQEIELGQAEIVAGKPFADPEHTPREAESLRQLLEHERIRARTWAGYTDAHATDVVVAETDLQGLRHLFVVPDTRSLLLAENPTVVGFFGRPREQTDHTVLFGLEDELVASMGTYADAGLLSYYDVELVKGSFGNLILFRGPGIPPEWRENPVHRRAVELSPSHYHEIRLHQGTLAGRLLDGGALTIEKTRYLGYEGEGVWRAVRHAAA